jgi:hypothetical protein
MTIEWRNDPSARSAAAILRKYLEAYVRALKAGDIGEVREAVVARSWRDERSWMDIPPEVMESIQRHLASAEAALSGPAVDVPGALTQIRSAIAHLPEA